MSRYISTEPYTLRTRVPVLEGASQTLGPQPKGVRGIEATAIFRGEAISRLTEARQSTAPLITRAYATTDRFR